MFLINCVAVCPAGVPLLEIVSAPDMRSGKDAYAYGSELRRIMRFLGVSNGEMQVCCLVRTWRQMDSNNALSEDALIINQRRMQDWSRFFCSKLPLHSTLCIKYLVMISACACNRCLLASRLSYDVPDLPPSVPAADPAAGCIWLSRALLVTWRWLSLDRLACTGKVSPTAVTSLPSYVPSSCCRRVPCAAT